MSRISTFEGVMLLAVVSLTVGLLVPRLTAGSDDVLLTKAEVLQMKIQTTYDQWRLNGGVHGQGDPYNPQYLTKNLLVCLTSEVESNFCSTPKGKVGGKLILGPNGVYETSKRFPSPAEVRLNDISVDSDFVQMKSSQGESLLGVKVNDGFGVVFVKSRWEVAVLK